MKITDIQSQKRKSDRMSVFVDGKYSFSLSLQDVQDHKIRIGLEVTELEIEKFKRLSQDGLVQQRAIEKALRRPHSILEIKQYLRKKDVDDDLADSIIERLITLKLLDDELFAQRWVEIRRKKSMSTSHIRGELKQKGVDESIVNGVLEESDDDNSLIQMVQRKARRYDDERKLTQYLQRKGFRYYDIQKAIQDFKED